MVFGVRLRQEYTSGNSETVMYIWVIEEIDIAVFENAGQGFLSHRNMMIVVAAMYAI